MNENKNNGLNEFNRRNIEGRNRRVRRRRIQKISVLVVYTLLIAIVAAVIWLGILSLPDIQNKLPQNNTPAVTTNGDGVTTPLGSGDSSVTTSPSTTTKPQETTTQEVTTPATPSDIIMIEKNASDIHSGSLILVDKDHPFVEPTNFQALIGLVKDENPNPTQKPPSLYFQANFVMLRPEVSKNLYAMANANLKDLGINDLSLSPTGAYRTFDEQQELFNSGMSNFPGGCSDFNTGYALHLIAYPAANVTYEFDNAKYEHGQKFIQWFNDNAYKYGFIQRFADTSGMYRYVGYIHAYIMKQQDLSFEAYLNALATKYTYSGEHFKITADDGKTYEIYYVPSTGNITSVPVPKSNPNYTISGDNIGGYIVTITLN